MTKFLERLRDPIHGLITFETDTDRIAWKLIDTPEFQRLRRIKQLGFSEFTFPGATHTRFAHSIGVYHNARRLMEVIGKIQPDPDPQKIKVMLLAALLHDVGHGPFSHAFEEARKKIASKRKSGPIEKHEAFTAKIIRNKDGGIYKAINDANLAEEIATVFDLKQPDSIYHAVVSSSFDADRLDFLVRDRYMTGTGAGAIDVDWLIDNLDKWTFPVGQDDDELEPKMVPTFVFKLKGRQAAEDFLLARYRLYTEVYLHKTTRGFEAILGNLLCAISDPCIPIKELNLLDDNPLVSFLRKKECIGTYLELDDYVIWDVIKRISKAKIRTSFSQLAKRLLNRNHLHVLDVSGKCDNDPSKLINYIEKLDRHAGNELGVKIFKDDESVNLYSTSDGEFDKIHKVVRVLNGHGDPDEIHKFADTIISSKLTEKTPLIRYYFLSAKAKSDAEKAIRGN